MKEGMKGGMKGGMKFKCGTTINRGGGGLEVTEESHRV